MVPAAQTSSASRSWPATSSTVASVRRERGRPASARGGRRSRDCPRSARAAWQRRISGRMAGTRSSWSVPNGSSSDSPVGRRSTRSEPMTPARGRCETPFSAAVSPAWMAGQVLSMIRTSPARRARSKAGAMPASPSEMAAVSMVATQPAPIRRSAWRPSCGRPMSLRPLAARRISSAMVTSEQPE
jgi:hypothetical protein